MVVRKDIVAVSIPFSAGVITAAVLPPGGDLPYWLAAGSCLAAAGLLFLYAGRGERVPAALGLSFVLGLFCWASAAARGPGVRTWPGAARALDALLRAIDPILFYWFLSFFNFTYFSR